ncbi:MAG: PIN domain-containing protein [Acidobacteria bacterium]|nr:PIN domain-containing protein [Acidobacteriota bacterium]
MNDLVAVLDACVLVPACLRDTLLRFAESPSFYRPVWSEEIMAETARTLHQKIGLDDRRVQRLITRLREAFPEAWIDGFEPLTERMTNDPKDRHVVAAAVQAGAHTIVTFNRKHFGPDTVSPFGIAVQSPDEFLAQQHRLHPTLALVKIVEQAAGIGREPEAILATLGTSAPRFVALIRQTHADAL